MGVPRVLSSKTPERISTESGSPRGVVTALCPGAVATELVAHIDGVVPLSDRLSPELVGRMVSVILGLPNTASVAELPGNTRLESTI